MLFSGCRPVYAEPYYPLDFVKLYTITDSSVERWYAQFRYVGDPDDVSGLFGSLNCVVDGVDMVLSPTTVSPHDGYVTYVFRLGDGLYDSEPSFLVNSVGVYTLTENSLLPFLNSMQGQIDFRKVVSFMGLAIVIPIGIVFMWFMLRKAIRSIMAAFRKGKVNA